MAEDSSAFKAGDVVKLKSGGPLMTVETTHTAGGQLMVICVWFRDANAEQPYSHAFANSLLTKAQVPFG